MQLYFLVRILAQGVLGCLPPVLYGPSRVAPLLKMHRKMTGTPGRLGSVPGFETLANQPMQSHLAGLPHA
jgi:hypothetical protein